MPARDPLTCELKIGDTIRARNNEGSSRVVAGELYTVRNIEPNFYGNTREGPLILVDDPNTRRVGQFRCRWEFVSRPGEAQAAPAISNNTNTVPEEADTVDDSLMNLRIVPCRHGGYTVVNSVSKVVVAGFTTIEEAVRFTTENIKVAA